MRTTLTLDDDVAQLIDEAVHRERRPLKQIVNEALRRGLRPAKTAEPYDYTPHHAKPRAGFDPAGFNRLVDELDDETALPSLRANR